MSYMYQWADAGDDAFLFTLGADGKAWDSVEKGNRRPEGYSLTPHKRAEMREAKPEVRIENFEEIAAGYSIEEALIKADPIAIRWLMRHITDQVPNERYGEIVGKTGPEKAKAWQDGYDRSGAGSP